MSYETFAALIAEHVPDASARQAHALAIALTMAADPHEARLEWLRRNVSREAADTKPIQAIKDLRSSCTPTPTLKEAKDAVDAYRASA